MKKKIWITGIVVAVVGIGIIGSQLYQDIALKKTYDALEAEFLVTDFDLPWYEATTVDFDGLQAINSDVVGWITLDGDDVISYPILQGEDDETYLHLDLHGERLKGGSIFLEARNASDFSDSYSIIYGHNMRDGSMFGGLKRYREEGFYEAHKTFTVYTPKGAYHYAVFGFEDVSARDEVYSVGFGTGEVYAEFLGNLLRRSEMNTGVSVSDTDRVVTLSTCSTSGRRFVVHGVLLETHLN